MVIANRAQMGLQSSTPDSRIRQLNEISNTALQAIEGVRDIAFNLSPYHLEQLGLTDAVRTMVGKIAASSKIGVTTLIDSIDTIFTKDEEIQVYRIVQECVTNVAKHSSATEASVALTKDNAGLIIVVRDNGKGFDASRSSISSRPGFGLAGLAERIKLLKGTLSIKSDAGSGTAIAIIVPINPKKHA